MMTRQDYIAIAKILSEARVLEGAGSRDSISHITGALADLMAAGNPRFDRARFLAAAEIQPHIANITPVPPGIGPAYVVTCPHDCNLGDTARQATREGAERRVDMHRLATS